MKILKPSAEYTKNNKTTVCFACLTPFHLFLSYLLAKTVYRDDYRILLLSDSHPKLREAFDRLEALDIWHEVMLINDYNQSYPSMRQQLSQIDFKSIDIVHYFSFGAASYNYLLLDYISGNTKIILTHEGIMTYFIQEMCEHCKRKYNLNPIDLNKIGEIWLLDKTLYTGKLNRPLFNIEIKKYLEDPLKYELCNELNFIFNYKYEKNNYRYDLLLFDQCLALAHILTPLQEKQLLASLIKEASKYDLMIKKHPSDSNNKYDDLNITLLEPNDIPWELIYLNQLINDESQANKVYLSYHSGAIINTNILCTNTNNQFILLNKILDAYKGYIEDPQYHNVVTNFLNHFTTLYHHNTLQLNSLSDLKDFLHTSP